MPPPAPPPSPFSALTAADLDLYFPILDAAAAAAAAARDSVGFTRLRLRIGNRRHSITILNS